MNNLQRSEQWHTDRAMKISGSRIASVMGVPGAFQSRKQLMQDFIDDYNNVEPQPVPDFLQVMFDWGNEHEEDCEDMVLEAVGGNVRHFGFMPHPTIDYVGMSPDGVLTTADGKKYLVEYKCPFQSAIPDEPPAKYVAQCQLGMEVMDIDDAILAYWWITNLGDPKVKLFYLERDRDWWAKAEDEIHKFWQEFLELRDNPVVEVTDEHALDVARRLAHVVSERAALQALEKELKAELKDFVREEDTVIGDFTAVHETRKGTIDMDRLQQDYAFDPDEYRKPATQQIKFIKRKNNA